MDDLTLLLGLILAAATLIATVLVPLFVWRRQRAKSRLSYVISSRDVVDIRDEAEGRVEVRFDDRPVPDVALVTVKFRNSGNVPIAPAHFEGPLSIELPNATILDYRVGEMRPDGLSPRVDQHDSSVTIEPLLLNPRDGFDVVILASGSRTPVTVAGRVEGVTELASEPPAESRADTSSRAANRWRWIGLASATVALSSSIASLVALGPDGSEGTVDQRDPVVQGCGSDAVDLRRTATAIRDQSGMVLGTLAVRYSETCNEAWAVIRKVRDPKQFASAVVILSEGGVSENLQRKVFRVKLLPGRGMVYTNSLSHYTDGVCVYAILRVGLISERTKCGRSPSSDLQVDAAPQPSLTVAEPQSGTP